MPTFQQAANTLRDRFTAEFHARRSEPIAYDNFSKLVDVNGNFVDRPGNAGWVRYNLRPSDSEQITFGQVGSRRFRQPGVVIVQIFVPTGSGDEQVHAIGDAIAQAMRGVTVNGVRLKATSQPKFVGPDGAWWQANTTTEYEFDLIA